MHHKKRTTEEYDQWLDWDQDTYQTGSTRPPKSHGGLIAFLLGLVIFLSGISTALGLMNIQLFRQLNELEEPTSPPVAFAHAEDQQTECFQEEIPFDLGFSGQTVPEFWNLYQDIPRGFYITDVSRASEAEKQGMVPGDIILQVDDIRIVDANGLAAALAEYPSQSDIQFILYRNQQEMVLTLRID